MSADYEVLGPDILKDLHDPTRDFAYDVLVGLSERPKRLPSKYFYDDAGSRYFQAIMDSPEYYPTDCEAEILEAHADAIVAPLLGSPINLVDLGAGDGKKTMLLIDALRRAKADFTFVPIDISEGAMESLLEEVKERAPDVRVKGLVCDYTDGVHHLHRQSLAAGDGTRNLVLFLGSNIGNFDRVRARAFLRRLWSALSEGDHCLIGFDLKKDIEVLLAAYNDRAGVTSAFNLNLLLRMNRDLGANFNVENFRHFGTYNVFSGAMESYLVSLIPQVVEVKALAQSFAFDAWEPVHTEYSYKYLRSDIDGLADDTGFTVVERFEDKRGWFQDALLEVHHPETPEPRR
ncbi:MAG: L-histidine N(alpha)-methyltransferase [Sandaracinaceae bacterium]